MDVLSPGSNIVRQLPDPCACVLYPWGKIACRHNIISTLRFSFHRILIKNISPLFVLYVYMCNHVDTSWPFGVLEYQHIKRGAVFWIFLPWDSLLNPLAFLQILQYISYDLFWTPAKFTFSNTAWKVFFSFVTNWKELTNNKRKWHSNMNPQSVKCLTHQPTAPTCRVELGF